ncbi:hypothetical protein B0A69_14470 [Chryseobacterium shigense]|uniref:Uncharacterized protein n=1 Tax=Chryseobacterium shigense TaxID=297244 RepID=A0A1N7JE07_9FLAO|nr:hypothetical protein [Chryseobacterium shigense]PQA92664.1 hypothetical protein B0A69_14470 [Chryseobacterium shigense]SIS47539.1 hypothetical protein SAMN05421639_10685 [Chryseobacterium shigense]
MKNLKNVKGAKMLTRNDQKSIIGGFNQCGAPWLPNQGCGPDQCCIGSACHPISDAGQQWGLCNTPVLPPCCNE